MLVLYLTISTCSCSRYDHMGTINSIFPIIIMLLSGHLIKRVWITSNEFWVPLNKLIYYLLFPCLMIFSISTANLQNTHASLFIPALISIVLLVMLFIWLSKPLFKDIPFFVSFIQGAVRYNSYVFISVTVFYIGYSVMPIIALITAYLVITTNVVSVFLLNIYSEKKKSLFSVAISTVRNPLILSCLIGLLMNYLSLKLPLSLNNYTDELGKASLPLSLLAVGASLHFDIEYRKIVGIFNCSMIKLVVLPAAVLIVMSFMHLPKQLIEVCLIYAGSPCTTNAYIMSKNMGGDYNSMGLIISAQTILSVFTIAMWLLLYNYYVSDYLPTTH